MTIFRCENPAALILPGLFLGLFLLLAWQTIRTGRITFSYLAKGARPWQRKQQHIHHERHSRRFYLQLAAMLLIMGGGGWLLLMNAAERCQGR